MLWGRMPFSLLGLHGHCVFGLGWNRQPTGRELVLMAGSPRSVNACPESVRRLSNLVRQPQRSGAWQAWLVNAVNPVKRDGISLRDERIDRQRYRPTRQVP